MRGHGITQQEAIRRLADEYGERVTTVAARYFRGRRRAAAGQARTVSKATPAETRARETIVWP
jgi:hypothetical protein